MWRTDGRWFVVAGTLSDTSKDIDDNAAILTFAGFPTLLETHS